MERFVRLIALLLGWVADKVWGDPVRLPHPVVGFGRLISYCEHRWNRGTHRVRKGGWVACTLVFAAFLATLSLVALADWLHPFCRVGVEALLIFYCLAGTTLVREVVAVFDALDVSVEQGRAQVARIVGRDTQQLTPDEVRTAALETLAENLSDGVIAPLCWLALLGVPGMVAYKMANTLDSMIGYRNVRYAQFGRVAARLDDVLNYIPARLTAFLMLLCAGRPDLWHFVRHYGRCHASPNAGYPEAALAGILGGRFGGPHLYFGEVVDKPYIGHVARSFTRADLKRAVRVNRLAEIVMVGLVALIRWLGAF